MASDLEGLRQAEERAAQFVRDEMYFDDLDPNKNDALLDAYRDAVEARVRAEVEAEIEVAFIDGVRTGQAGMVPAHEAADEAYRLWREGQR